MSKRILMMEDVDDGSPITKKSCPSRDSSSTPSTGIYLALDYLVLPTEEEPPAAAVPPRALYGDRFPHPTPLDTYEVYVEEEEYRSSDDADYNEADESSEDESVEDDEFEKKLLWLTNNYAGEHETEEEVEYEPFTLEETQVMQSELREIGMNQFIQNYVHDQHVPIPKLLDMLGFSLPYQSINLPQERLLPLLTVAIRKFLAKRMKLPHVNTLDDVLHLLSTSKRILVLTGAGVSVSCGIPDFRSRNGIYSRLDDYHLDDPQQMFDIGYFRDEPHVFYSFAREIFPSNFTPSPTHNFIKLLEDKGVLLRNYTQNIDTLEQIAGITNVLQCHGSFASASCIACGHRVNGSAIQDDIFKQQIPYCPICTQNNTVQNELAIMKPDIVFFGESLPKSFDEALLADREQVDLLVVMGSSLKVAPVSEIMGHLPHRIPQIVINKTPITHMQFDVQLLGDCDTIVPELCRRLGWELEHEQLPGGKASLGSSEVFTFHPPCTFAFQGAELPVRFLQQDE